MSDFMFGGSALTLDISAVNGTGAAVKRGDVLQISLKNSDTPDGHKAVVPVLSNGGVSQLAPMGVVIAPEGLEIGDGDGVILRVMGRCDVLGTASTAYAVDGIVYGTTGQKYIANDTTIDTSSYTQAIVGGRLRGVVLTGITTTTAGELVDCFVSGLP